MDTMQMVFDSYPHLWPFLYTPGYLQLAVSTHNFKCGYQLKTMTGLILKKLLQKASDPRVGKKYIAIIDKVKKLTYRNVKERQWLTREKDLVEPGLTESELVDTEIMEEMKESSRTMDYCCRFEQEFYAGCYTLHMEKEEFLEFATEVATQDHFEIPTAVACGLLFDDVVRRKFQTLGDAPHLHLDYKRELMEEFLIQQWNAKKNSTRMLEVCKMLYEGQRGMRSVIRKAISSVEIGGYISPMYHVKAIAFVIQQCLVLEKLVFFRSGLNDRSVELFYEHVINSEVKFPSLDVSCNCELTPECMYLLAKCMIRCKCRIFKAIDCGLTPHHIKRFAAGISDGKFDSLDLSGNRGLGAEGMYHLGMLVGNALVVSFSADNCDLGDKEWKKFSEGVDKAKAAAEPKVQPVETKVEPS